MSSRPSGDLDYESLLEARERFDTLVAGVTLLALTARVNTRAMDAFLVVVKTLDALHIASALLISSYDEATNRCGRALGFATPLR